VRSLFWKIFLGFWLTLVVMSAAVGVVVHLYQQARLADMADVANSPRAELAVASLATALEYGGPDEVAALVRQWPGRRPLRILVVDEQGRDLLGRPVPAGALAQARAQAAQPDAGPGVRQARAPDGARYVLFLPRAEGRPARRHASLSPRDTFYIRLAMALLAGVVFSGVLAWYLSRPLGHLRRATHRLAEGHLDARVAPQVGRRRDEIGELGRDFDHMAGRLQAAVVAQQRLLHDVSHELRSPLARLQVAVGLARQNPAKVEASLARVEGEAERLNELVGELLTLSRLEAGVCSAPPEDVDLIDVLTEVVADARFEAEALGRRVDLRAQAPVHLRGHGELLRRALENVIRNAVQHTAAGTTVEVSLGQLRPGWATVSVADRGPGVADADLGALFEPFFRGSARSGREGYGLGLAIARGAVEAHGGRIAARNRAHGGLRVEIELPLSGT